MLCMSAVIGSLRYVCGCVAQVTRLSPVSQVVNFGDNLSGWTKIFVKGPAGSNVTLKHAEVLQHPPYGPANGEIYQGNLRSALATGTRSDTCCVRSCATNFS